MSVKDLLNLSFELSPTCNMACQHPFCPVNDPLRYPKHESRTPCSDDAIINFSKAMYAKGFNGFIAFHYYSDPLMDLPRLLNIVSLIRTFKPYAKFIVWTNGLLLNEDSRNWIPFINEVIITMHNPGDRPRIEEITKGLTNIRIQDNQYDNRLGIYDCTVINKGGCSRPSRIELPINYYGNVRLCCSEFRGTVSIGNIQLEEPDAVINNFEETALSVQQGLVPICWQCRGLSSNAVVP